MSQLSELLCWPLTDVGATRDHNEDSFLVDPELGLYVVADGMGGHAAGEVASKMAVEVVREVVRAGSATLEAFDRGDGGSSRRDILRLLESAIQRACSTIYEAGVRDETKRGMGTTVDVLLVVGSRGFIGHVGDSRVYLQRQKAVHQLTEDHSLVNELLKRGKLTREQIDKIKYKNAVTRAVGVYESVEVDVFDFDVLPGDSFLLCTDGLHGYFEGDEAELHYAAVERTKLARYLIDLANQRGGQDNITVVIVDVPAEDGQEHRANELNLKLDVLQKMPVFRHLSYRQLVRVLNITAVRSYDQGEHVVTEGEQGDALFIVLDGEALVHATDSEIARLGRGQHFGEMALVDRSPRSASVTAVTDLRLMVIRRSDFFDIIRKSHDVAVKLLWSFLGVLAERLRSTSKELGEARVQLGLEELLSPLDSPYQAGNLGDRLSLVAEGLPDNAEGTGLASIDGPPKGRVADLEDLEEADDIDMDTLPVDAIGGGAVPKTEIMGKPPAGMGTKTSDDDDDA